MKAEMMRSEKLKMNANEIIYERASTNDEQDI